MEKLSERQDLDVLLSGAIMKLKNDAEKQRPIDQSAKKFYEILREIPCSEIWFDGDGGICLNDVRINGKREDVFISPPEEPYPEYWNTAYSHMQNYFGIKSQ